MMGKFNTFRYITWDHAQEYTLLSLFYLENYLLEDTLYERNCVQALKKQEENLPISVQSTHNPLVLADSKKYWICNLSETSQLN